MRRLRFWLYSMGLCTWCSALPSLCSADMYKFVDEHGVTHYTNIPGDPRAIVLWRDNNGPKALDLPAGPVYGLLKEAPVELLPEIEAAAQANAVEPALLKAVISVESRYNPQARSPKGAMGLMQLMPDTARRFGVANAFDVRQNINGGARYLRQLMDLFDNDLELVLAAYNAGEKNVIRAGRRIPAFAETRRYVPTVLGQLALLRSNASRQTTLH